MLEKGRLLFGPGCALSLGSWVRVRLSEVALRHGNRREAGLMSWLM